MRKYAFPLVLFVILSTAVVAFVKHVDAPQPPQILQAGVTRGSIVQSVVATGAIGPARTVNVGTEVSGMIKKIDVDYNSVVTKGEVLAELDPSIIQAQLDSAKASFDRAKLDEQQHEQQLLTDRANEVRAETLYSSHLIDDQDREAAELTVKEDEALIKEDEAQLTIAQAGVDQSELDLQHCVIKSPIDGVVIERDVDQGQAVAARVSAPTLFILASDLRHLQVIGDVDESEVAKIRQGQPASLTVEAYPKDVFPAKVTSVRLNALSTSNVVTYQVAVEVQNPELKLRPGMTATLTFDIWRRGDVVRVPSPALQFRPTPDIFKALGQPVPAGTRAAPVLTPVAPQVTPVVTPSPGASAKIIDAFFEAPPSPVASGQVWVLRDGHLAPVAVKLGITDGPWTEVLEGSIEPGQLVVTNVVIRRSPAGH